MKTIKLSLSTKRVLLCAVLCTLLLSACKKDRNTGNGNLVGPNVNFFALLPNNKLALLNAQTGQSGGQSEVTGLQAGESLIAIDFRPATGQLYGLGSTSRLYVIDLNSAVAKAVGSGPFTPALSGTSVGFDFNPTVDRIRVVTSTGQNLRLNPETGAVAATDANVSNTSSIASVAYTNNKAGAATTVLYDIDATTNKLFKQDPPNDGTLVEVGSLNVDAEGTGGFDIAGETDIALAALTVGGQSGLYSIDLATGKASLITPSATSIIGIAIPTQPVAYAISNNNELIILNPATGTVVNKPITGIQADESILGIDSRPATGQLYILGSTNRIYTVNASSGLAAVVGAAPFSTLLSGTDFGFDFNPVVDKIRIVSNTGQNLRVDPVTGEIAGVDAALNPGTPSVTAAAYTNNFAGATTTTLFVIDSGTGNLYKQDPPNNGTLLNIGSLGANITGVNGFDIGGYSNKGYAILTTPAGTKFYQVSLTTGQLLAGVSLTAPVRGFTIGLGF